MKSSDQNPSRDHIGREAFQCREALKVYAFGMLRDWAVAEDVVQDAFIVVMDKYETFEPGSSMMAWTRAIVRRKVLQYLDREKRRESALDQVLCDAVDAALAGVNDETYGEEFRTCCLRLRNCLSRLAGRSRKLLEHVYADGMSYEAAAKLQGMTVEAVRKNLYRAKQQLRACLQREIKEVSG